MIVGSAGKGSRMTRDWPLGFRYDLYVIIKLLGCPHGLFYASRIWSTLTGHVALVSVDLELKNFANGRLCCHRAAHQLMPGFFAGSSITRLLGLDDICIYV